MMRKYRENECGQVDDPESISMKFKQYVDGLDFRERHLLETSVKIHSFICYELRDDEREEKQKDDDEKNYENENGEKPDRFFLERKN